MIATLILALGFTAPHQKAVKETPVSLYQLDTATQHEYDIVMDALTELQNSNSSDALGDDSGAPGTAAERRGVLHAITGIIGGIGTGVRDVTRPPRKAVASVAGGVHDRASGMARMLTFWKTAGPIYMHYQSTRKQTRDLPDDEMEAAYQKLHEKYAPEVRDLFAKLRGFFIKLAQLGSVRDDFVPAAYMEFFKEFQDAAPFSLGENEVIAMIEEELGVKNWREVFESLDPVPFASATIGQVIQRIFRKSTACCLATFVYGNRLICLFLFLPPTLEGENGNH